MNTSQQRNTVAILAWAALATACGGGGDSSPSVTNYPSGQPPRSGDYLIYTTSSVPASTGDPVVSIRTIVNAETAPPLHVIYSYSNSTPIAGYTYDGTGALTLQETANKAKYCTYTPALLSAPRSGSLVGQTSHYDSTEDCSTSTAVPAYPITQISGDLTYVGLDTVTTGLGTFNAFKINRAQTRTDSGGKNILTQTCWADMATGWTVLCTSTNQYQPTGAAAPTSTSSSTFALEAYWSQARGLSAGPLIKRFIGSWTFRATGGMNVACNSIGINATGTVSGTCLQANASGTGTVQTTLQGSIDIDGKATLTTATGLSWTGTLTPYNGSGTWSGNGTSGTWGAAHN